MPDDPLHELLLALCGALPKRDPPLMVVGGYGLVLRARYQRTASRQHPSTPWVRSTDDLDLLLGLELLASSDGAARLAGAIRQLGFIEHVPRMCFRRERTPGTPAVGIDLMAPDPDRTRFPTLRVDANRVKAAVRGTVHGRRTEGAHLVLEAPQRVTLGQGRAEVHLPTLFGFVVLKVLAYRDAVHATDAAVRARQGTHAADLLVLCAGAEREEFDAACAAMHRHRHDPAIQEVRRVISAHFGAADASGTTSALAAVRESGGPMDVVDRMRALEVLGYLERAGRTADNGNDLGIRGKAGPGAGGG